MINWISRKFFNNAISSKENFEGGDELNNNTANGIKYYIKMYYPQNYFISVENGYFYPIYIFLDHRLKMPKYNDSDLFNYKIGAYNSLQDAEFALFEHYIEQINRQNLKINEVKREIYRRRH